MLDLANRSSLGRIVILMGLLTLRGEAAFEVGAQLPRPDLTPGGLVQPKKFALPPVKLDPATRVVVFFYSAAWCDPCQRIGAALRTTYPRFRAGLPGLQIISYAVDDSPGARADYLRDQRYPWPALGPTMVEAPLWPTVIPGGTPQFQAFAVGADHLTAITSAGPADTIMEAAMRFLQPDPE